MIRETLDRRGVSEVIGSILVFGLVVALLTILQTQAVPSTNEDIEFQHSQQVQGDFARLSDAVTRSAVRGTSETVTLETGTSYPNRLVLFNPPPATGQLRSGTEAPVFLSNVVASDVDARDYVDGSVGFTPGMTGVGNAPRLATADLSYRPSYNQYRSAPVTASEYGVVYDEHADETLLERRPSIVDGKEIDLRFLTGGYTGSGMTTTVRTDPVSAGGSGLAVRSANDFLPGNSNNVTLYLPTELPESVWTQELLADAIDDPDGGANGAGPEADDTCAIVEGSVNGAGASTAITGSTVEASAFGDPDLDNDRYVRDCLYVDDADGQNYVVLVLEPEAEYDLRMSKVGFGASTSLGPQYVVPTDRSATLGDGGDARVSVQVRDRYNNPVSGVELTAALSTAGNAPSTVLETATESGDSVTVTTDDEGLATVSVAAGSAFSSGEVTFSGTFDDDDSTVAPAEEAAVSVSTTGSPPVTLTNATLTADDAVNLTVRNDGPVRSVTAVQVSEVTVEDKKSVIESADLVTTIDSTVGLLTGASLNTGSTNTTDVVDGPDELAGMGVETPPVAFGTLPEEGGPPVTAPTTVSGRTIASGEEVNVTLVLDAPVTDATSDGNFEEGDALRVAVTLTFDDGHRETYHVRIEAPDDDAR